MIGTVRPGRVHRLVTIGGIGRTIPDAEVHVFANCGHWVMIEQRAAWESAVLAFLTRKDGHERDRPGPTGPGFAVVAGPDQRESGGSGAARADRVNQSERSAARSGKK